MCNIGNEHVMIMGSIDLKRNRYRTRNKSSLGRNEYNMYIKLHLVFWEMYGREHLIKKETRHLMTKVYNRFRKKGESLLAFAKHMMACDTATLNVWPMIERLL